jgi:hypothetical protein
MSSQPPVALITIDRARGEWPGHQLATRRAHRWNDECGGNADASGERGRGLRLNDAIRLRLVVRQCGAWLALLALTLQLGMSFGHFHARDIAGAGATTFDAAKGWRGAPTFEATALKGAKLADGDDRCPICFSDFLLATSFVPDAAQASLLAQFADLAHSIARDFDRILETRRAPFQSRAPPLV